MRGPKEEEDHPDWHTRKNMSNVYQTQGRYKEALRVYHQAQEVYLAVYSQDSQEVALSCFNLGHLLLKMNQPRKAAYILRKALWLTEGAQHALSALIHKLHAPRMGGVCLLS